MIITQFQSERLGATLTERSAAQEHVLDLCRALGQPTPAEADPAGDRYAFEKGAATSTGGQGFVDVWMLNLCNQRPSWLTDAHAALDRAVWAAYG